jgi:hypothetical protein
VVNGSLEQSSLPGLVQSALPDALMTRAEAVYFDAMIGVHKAQLDKSLRGIFYNIF